MDTETAIKEIKDRIELEWRHRFPADLAPDYIEALEMAIEALQKIEMLKKERTNSFVDIRNEALSDSEKEGVEKLFDMMLSLRQQIQLRKSFEKEMSRNEMLYDAKLCPFCGGEATMRPEGDYWEITCDDCGVSKQGSTYDEALNEWNLRRL